MFERVLSWEVLGTAGRLGILAALVSAPLFTVLPASAAADDVGKDKADQKEGSQADDDRLEVSSENPQPDDDQEFGELVLPPWEANERKRGTIPSGSGPSSSSMLGRKEAFDARQRAGSVQGFAGVPQGLAVNGSVSTSLIYDNNPLLESSGETGGESTSVWGYGIQPGLNLTHRSARTVFQSLVRLSFDDLMPIDSEREIDLGSFDQYGGVQLDRLGPRTRLNLFANVSNGTTRTEIVEDTGRGLSDDRVLTYGGGGSLIYAMSPRAAIQAFAAARRREVETAGFGDYTSLQAGAAYGADLTSTKTAGLVLQYERFMFDAPASPDADILTALASWSQRVNYALSFDLEVGPQVIFIGAMNGVSDEETALVLSARATVDVALGERDRLSLSGSRSAGPSVTGEIRTHNLVEASYERQMSRDISFRLPVALSIQDGVFADGSESRFLFSVAPKLIWEWAPMWGLSVEYRYRMEDDEGRSSASSNQVILSLRYFSQLLP